MTTIRRLALALSLVLWSLPCSSQLQDDGYTGVNLGFSFPFYDKTFNQAYMYDNGIVSFLQPGNPDAVQPWQWSGIPLNQTNGKYFIAPLWADIAPVPQTTYNISQTATSAKFSWNNIAEYYSRGGVLRLNSFSLEINANGDIATKYFGLNLRTSNISIGFRGDNDYTQIAYYPYNYILQSQADWTANTKVAAPVIVPKQEPIPEPVIEQPTVSEPIQTTQIVQNPVQNITQNPVQTIAPTSQVTSQVTNQPEAKSEKKVAAKAQQVDMSVVDAAISIAMTSASQSVNEQPVVSNSFSLSNSTLAVKQANNQIVNQRQTVDQLDITQQSNTNSEKKDALEFFVLNSLDRQESRQDQKDKGINRSVSPNMGLGAEVPLFSVYAQVMLPDNPFYAPKQVYKNQRVVDNNRLLRSLSNDARFEQIINQQYQR
jgi:hypothetical protein